MHFELSSEVVREQCRSGPQFVRRPVRRRLSPVIGPPIPLEGTPFLVDIVPIALRLNQGLELREACPS